MKKRLWNLAMRRYYSTTTTDGFADFTAFYGASREGALKARRVEVMVHPGGGEAHGFAREMKLFQSDWRDELPFAVNLLNYHDL